MAEPLWTIGEIVSATSGASLGAHATPVAGISIDSRSLAEVSASSPFAGRTATGMSFVQGALGRGRRLRHRRPELSAQATRSGWSASRTRSRR